MDIYSGRRESLNEPANDGWIISQDNPASGKPKNWFRLIVISGIAVVMLGGITSVVVTIKRTTDTFTNAANNQNNKVKELLNDMNGESAPDTSFGLVAKVQAQQNNPFDANTQYQNPFLGTPNPFDEVEQ